MSARKRILDPRGFGLAEVVVCAGLLVAVAAGVAQLVAMAVRANDAARVRTVATILAAQRMEQLRGLPWGAGSDRTTDLSTDPPTAAGRGLLPSPAGTLEADVAPYVDYLTAEGDWAGNGAAPPAAAVYTRRWSVQPLDADPGHTLVLTVLVRRTRAPGGEEISLASIRARRR